MKQTVRIYLVILVISFSFGFVNLIGQCDLELQEQIEKEIEQDKVEFLKKFTVKLEADEKVSSFSMVLSKRTWYRFYIFESEKYSGVGHFEMRSGDVLLGRSLNELTGKKNHYFDFKCNETQAYNFSVYKDGGEKYCSEIVLACVSKNEKDGKAAETLKEVDKDVFMVVDVDDLPIFTEDGQESANRFREWMNNQMQYPEEAVKQKIEGRVFVQFVVSDKGQVKDVKVVRGVHPILDKYAVELVQSSPKWTKPGYKNGVAVNVLYTFPISFNL